jgi:TPP-dependent pyruvate/acetoin dehydrogenase alpha subunit
MSEKNFTLGDLVNPSLYHQPLDISSLNEEQAFDFYRKISLIRAVERQLAKGRRDGLIGGPVHLGVGQEAVAVGVSASLRPSDRVFGAHRSHSHILALGGSVHALFAEVLGKESGASKGMGGSMHLWDQRVGFYGSVPIVSGTVPLAVGAGLSAKLQGTSDVGVAYLGDGAIEEGVVHESLNLARILNIPIIFVVENNLFASHMHISLRQPRDATARFAHANDIPYKIIDGNDVVAVADAARELINAARSGKGPGFLEAVTYRWYGHVDWREDVDVGVHRSIDELENWRARDPLGRLRISMIDAKIFSEQKNFELMKSINDEIENAWDSALNDPYPKEDALISRVYAE